MRVRDVMTEATITKTAADKLRSAAERTWREQTGSLLITTDGRLTGIITERDVLRAVALSADPDRATVDEAMTILSTNSTSWSASADWPGPSAATYSRRGRPALSGRR